METLPLLAEIADRVAPWVAVHVALEILVRSEPGNDYGRCLAVWNVDGLSFSACGGLACYRQHLVLMSLRSPRAAVKVLCHELAHVIWHGGYLNAKAMEVIREAIADRPLLPGNYNSSESESVAAFFEGWAFSRFFGLPVAVEDAPGLTVHSVFEEIWSGDLARWLIGRDQVPGAAALRRRLGIPAYVPPAPPPPAPVEVVGSAVCNLVSRVLDAASSLLFKRILSLPAAI